MAGHGCCKDFSGDSVVTWWWLRSPGNNDNNAAAVSPGGLVNHNGNNVNNNDNGGVRPAFSYCPKLCPRQGGLREERKEPGSLLPEMAEK